MKVVTEKREVITDGMARSRNFSIEVGAHIMNVLSGLYKNPLAAIVREYLTNMYDAYVALGPYDKSKHPTPVLHLPTQMEPWIEFRDHGIGMSVDTVWNIYSTYGASTKNTNNAEVGGFGLGSKTAFCYQNGQSWTIESRYDGEIHRFMASLDDNGIPTLYHVGSEPSDEPSGVTIKIPVLREDTSKVLSAAELYVPYFPMELVVTGADVPTGLPEPVVEGTNWRVLKGGEGRGTKFTIRVIMGNVPYDLDGDLAYPFTDLILSTFGLYYFSYSNRLEITVPIGSVDLVPSRDHLKFTSRTEKFLRRRLETFKNEYMQKLKDKLEEELVPYERLKIALEFRKQNLVSDRQLWSNLFSYSVNLKDVRETDKKVKGFIHHISEGSGEHTAVEWTVANPLNVTVESTYIMIDDVANGARVAKWFVGDKFWRKTRTGRKASNYHKTGDVLLLSTNMANTSTISTVFGGFPEDKIVFASALVHVAKKVGVKGPENIYRFNYRTASERWDARVRIPDNSDTRYYVVLDKTDSDVRYRYSGQVDFSALQSFTQTFKVETPEYLYGIRKDEEKKLAKGKSWVRWDTYVLKQIEERFEKMLSDSTPIATFSSDYDKSWNWVRAVAALWKDHKGLPNDVRQLIDYFSSMIYDERMNYHRIMSVFKTVYPDLLKRLQNRSKSDRKKLHQMVTTIRTKYPMFSLYGAKVLHSYETDVPAETRIKIILDYLQSCN